ncbi:MAG: hypothetical protein ABSA47_11500 [Verrucomicrobiota bacterium]|jgi:hypothetical protein
MKTTLECFVALLCLAQFAFRAGAQVTVPISSLPGVTGEYNLSYVRTNLDTSPLIGQSGSNYWDLSRAASASDSVQRLDIVPVTDGGNGASFPDAAYAQRYTGGIYSTNAWEYYRISNGVGRLYYGFYNAQSPYVDPLVVFPQSTTDLPDPVQYGHSWSRQLNYQLYDIFGGTEDISFTENATVDAFGTLVLPGFGPLQALRITAIDSYDISLDGIDFGTEVDTNYVWLVPGVGYAAEVIIYGPDPLGGTQPFTNYFQRVFLSAPVAPPTGVSLAMGPGTAILSWSSSTNGSGYFVRTLTNLTITNWTPVGQLTNLSLVVPTTAGTKQQFFQVTAQP